MLTLLLSLACGTDPSQKSPGATESGATSSTDDTPTDTTSGSPGVLYGTLPEVALPAPEFEVLAHDETPRTRDDLLGHPSVVWFYPAANTGG